jgi:hypothetical protein
VPANALPPLEEKYIMKEVTKIVIISKKECEALQKLGYKFGDDLHKSYSEKPKYYLTENEWALKDLEKLRKSHVVGKYQKGKG